jgi:hypothetical protein
MIRWHVLTRALEVLGAGDAVDQDVGVDRSLDLDHMVDHIAGSFRGRERAACSRGGDRKAWSGSRHARDYVGRGELCNYWDR